MPVNIVQLFLTCQFLGFMILISARFDINCDNDPQVYPPWLIPQSCYNQPFHDMYIFGDSYSDNGQPLKNQRYYEEHYFPDRYSNGPMCVEYFVKMMGSNLYNFAYSGATVDNFITYRNTLDIHQQLETFKKKGGPAKYSDTTLYGFWIGTNDVEEIFKTQSKTLYQMPTTSPSFSVKHILVMGLLPIDHMPIISTMITHESDRGPVTDLVARFNRGLEALVMRFKYHHKDAQVYFYNTDWYSDQFFHGDNPLFTDVEQPCLEKEKLCPDENRHLWWDDYHPTTATSFLIAKDLYQSLFSE
ncbi:unnamed protein product [Absidia cylindrospora]